MTNESIRVKVNLQGSLLTLPTRPTLNKDETSAGNTTMTSTSARACTAAPTPPPTTSEQALTADLRTLEQTSAALSVRATLTPMLLTRLVLSLLIRSPNPSPESRALPFWTEAAKQARELRRWSRFTRSLPPMLRLRPSPVPLTSEPTRPSCPRHYMVEERKSWNTTLIQLANFLLCPRRQSMKLTTTPALQKYMATAMLCPRTTFSGIAAHGAWSCTLPMQGTWRTTST